MSTNPEKVVAVAKDVLARLSNLVLTTGAYICNVEAKYNSGDLQEYVDEIEKECQVCLLGACLLSKARLFSNVPIENLKHEDKIYPSREQTLRALTDVFEPEQLDMIESAFMLRLYSSLTLLERTNEQREKPMNAVSFGFKEKRYYSSMRRVRDIMENIITHGGVFVPEDDPEPTTENRTTTVT